MGTGQVSVILAGAILVGGALAEATAPGAVSGYEAASRTIGTPSASTAAAASAAWPGTPETRPSPLPS
jgi:hypothetical protein